MKDIQTHSDIEKLVNDFYNKVLKEEQLAPFFKNLDFEKHLPRMIHFWAFVLLDESGYTTNVTDKHINMSLKKNHFDKWIMIFNDSVDSLFHGDKADLAKQRASVLAWTIMSKMK